MTNKQRQDNLDKKKWLESEKLGCNLGGAMDYCQNCEHASEDNTICLTTQEKRETEFLCAKNYNRLYKKRK